MSIERARKHLEKYGFADRIYELSASSATVALAAEALGTEQARIAKSLSFLTPDGPILVIAAGDVKIDNKKYKEKFAAKARMIPPEDVERLIGHAIGGVCPFGISDGVRVYLDESLRRFDIVYPAAGTAASAVKLTVEELELASEAICWVDLTAPREV